MKKIVDEKALSSDLETAALFLLGKILARKTSEGEIIRGRITEIEMYSQEDSACHAFKRKTPRNAPLFECAGTLYVHLCYGLFNLINIVCGKKDYAQGLLIRGVNNVFGSGRVAKFFQIEKSLNLQNIFTSSEIWLENDGFLLEPNKISRFKRVGIHYAAQEDQNKLWRWRIEV